MKKIIVVLLGILLLCACENKNRSTLDIEAASASLDNEMKNMITLEDRELEAIYGLDLSLMNEHIIKSEANRNGYLYALIKVDDKNTKEVEKQMNNLFDILKSQSNLYSPEAVKIIDNRIHTTVGNYLVYISYKDNDKAYDLVKGNIK